MKTKKKPFRLDILFLILSLVCFGTGGLCTYAAHSLAKPVVPVISDNADPGAPGLSTNQTPADNPQNSADGQQRPLSTSLTLAGNLDQPEVLGSLSGSERLIARLNDPSLLTEEMADQLKRAGVQVLCLASDQILGPDGSSQHLEEAKAHAAKAGLQVTGLNGESPAILEANNTRIAVLSYTYNILLPDGNTQFPLDESTPPDADIPSAVNLYGNVKSDYSDNLINAISSAKTGPDNPADYVIVYLQCNSELTQNEPLLQSLIQNMKEKGADLIVIDDVSGALTPNADPAAEAGTAYLLPGQISSGSFFQITPAKDAPAQISGPLSLEQLASVHHDPDDPEAKG